MDSAIYFYDAQDPQWGSLSNNYPKRIIVDDKSYKSVTHFIYSHLMGIDTSYGSKILQETDPTAIPKIVNNIVQERNIEVIRASVENGLKSMIQKPEFRKRLTGLKGKVILYDSYNDILGIGRDKNGRNIYGNMLMSLRDKILTAGEDDYKDLYQLYSLIYSMKELLTSGKDDLSSFIDQNPQEIKIQILNPVDYKLFVELLQKKSLADLDILEIAYQYPTTIARVLRKRFIQKYNEALMTDRKSSIMNIYLSSIIASKYREVKQVDLAISQQINKLGEQELQDLQDRLYKLYLLGMFPSELSARLNKIFPEVVKGDELKKIVGYKEPPSSEIIIEQKEKYENVLIPDRGDVLSPTYVDMIYIDNFPYPSLSHYILFSLMVNLPSDVGLFNTVRANILKNPLGSQTDPSNYKDLDTLSNIYFEFAGIQFNKAKLRLLETALNAKFNSLDNDILEVLKKSGNRRLIYNDPEDEYLGTGLNNRGQNMTGIVIMKIRDTYAFEEKQLKPFASKAKWDVLRKRPAIYPKQVLSSYLQNDKILIEWVAMRLEDICRVMALVHKYAENVRGKTILIDKNMSSFVIDDLYKVCYGSKLNTDMIGEIPDDFEQEMRKYLPKNVMFGREAIENTWKYIGSLVYNLKRYASKNYGSIDKKSVEESLSSIIENVLDERGSKQPCNGPYPINDRAKNCIFRALMTVSMKIKNFVSENYGLSNLDLDEVLLDTSIDIIMPKTDSNTKKYAEYKPVELKEEDEKILKYLPSFDPRGVMENLNGMYDMFEKIIDNRDFQNRKFVRLLFFLNETPEV